MHNNRSSSSSNVRINTSNRKQLFILIGFALIFILFTLLFVVSWKTTLGLKCFFLTPPGSSSSDEELNEDVLVKFRYPECLESEELRQLRNKALRRRSKNKWTLQQLRLQASQNLLSNYSSSNNEHYEEDLPNEWQEYTTIAAKLFPSRTYSVMPLKNYSIPVERSEEGDDHRQRRRRKFTLLHGAAFDKEIISVKNQKINF